MKNLDPIIEEIHLIREKLLSNANNDIRIVGERANDLAELFRNGEIEKVIEKANSNLTEGHHI